MCVSKQRQNTQTNSNDEKGGLSGWIPPVCRIPSPKTHTCEGPLIISFKKIPDDRQKQVTRKNTAICLNACLRPIPDNENQQNNLIDFFFTEPLYCLVIVAVAAGVLEWWHPGSCCISEHEFSRSYSGSQSSRRRTFTEFLEWWNCTARSNPLL